MIHKEFNFELCNTSFHGAYYQPEKIKAVIVLVHGMGEHSKRYEKNVISLLNQNNFAVITYDQFGHGLTAGKRGHNPGFQYVLDCVDIVIQKAKSIFGNYPILLYGHSMGGNVVINYVLQRKHDLKAVIATSPFLKLAFEPPSWKLGLGKALAKIIPSITMSNELDINAISRDKVEVDLYKKDALVHDKVSPNYSIVFMQTGEWAIANAKMLKTPMLLMHGTGDRLTSSIASCEFAKNAGDIVDLELIEGGYHELHNDIIKNEILDKMIKWINKKIT